MNAHVFTYGSLMFPEVWSRVVAGSYASMTATLAGHGRFAIQDELYPGMVPAADASVRGTLYLDVAGDDLDRLDRFEGDEYRRLAVDVLGADGVVRMAETYIYRAAERLLASEWHAGDFAMQRFLDTYCRDKLDP